MSHRRTKEFWNWQFGVVSDWLAKKGYMVVLDTDVEDQVDFTPNIVQINSRQHAESRFYTLLHEAGHVLIRQGWRQFHADHPMYTCSTDGRAMRGRVYRVSLVAEECEAWKRGRRLAKRFGLYVYDKKYDRISTDCLMSHIKWAANNESIIRQQQLMEVDSVDEDG
jgi:hypothetical protein